VPSEVSAPDGLTFDKEKTLAAKFAAKGLTITEPKLTPFRASMKPYYDQLETKFGTGSIAEAKGD
jgi:TRAP-type C4-dicarboxylate transport system substrate-binding protein